MHIDQQSVRISHKEFVREITGSPTFAVQASLSLNPGNAEAFPWLSQIAGQFQEYSFKGIVFHYVPSSGTAVSGTNSALGTVMLQTSYRANDSAPTSKQEMMNEYWSGEVVPSETLAHPIECNPKENPFNVQYVRTQPVPTGDSVMLYDLGLTHIATSGQQGTNVVGDLWVTYDIELKKPILASNVTATSRYAAVLNGTGAIDTGNFWGNPATYLSNNNPAVTVSGRRITFPKNCVGVWTITTMLTASVSQWQAAHDFGPTPTLSNCSFAGLSGYPNWTRFNATGTASFPTTFSVATIRITDSSAIAYLEYGAVVTAGGTLTSSQTLIEYVCSA